jgi:probable phosphoglycerate mutase
MRLLLIRHAQDERGYRGGWSQRGLTRVGFDQASRLAFAVNRCWRPVEMVLSSDLRRAKETAQSVSNALGLPLHTKTAWREINNGDLAGISHHEANRRYPGLFFNRMAWLQTYPNGESPCQFFERIRTAFDELTCEMRDGTLPSNVVLVTHGGVINVVRTLACRAHWNNCDDHPSVAFTALYELEYDGACWRLMHENNIDHLHAPTRSAKRYA